MRSCLIFSAVALSLLAFAACGDAEGNPIAAGGPGGGDGSPGRDGSPGGDGSLDEDADGDGHPDPPNLDPMLAVACATGVQVWRHAASLATDATPDFTLALDGLGGGVTALASAKNHLWASRVAGDAVLRFDDATSLQESSRAAATLAIPARVRGLTIDAGDRLWVNTGSSTSGGVFMFASASTTTGPHAASFTHPYEQIMANAYEPKNNRLIASQISGAGVLVWNDASTRTGTPANDFALTDGGHAYWTMKIASDRLYAAGAHSSNSAGVAIWPNAGDLAAPTAPIVLTNGYGVGKFISHLVVRGDVLAVAARDEDKILVYKNATQIAGDRPADFTITHPSMVKPSQLAIDANGRLYVVDDDGILVFASVGTGPAFVTEIKTGVNKPEGLVLVE